LDDKEERNHAASGEGRKSTSHGVGQTGTQPSSNNALNEISFGDHMPSSCPPPEAGHAKTPLYRLVPQGDLTDDGFKTTREEGLFPEGDPCKRCSISTYANRQHAEKLRAKATHFVDHELAVGTLPPEAGVVMKTKSNWSRHHYSWWPTAGIVRHCFFQKVT
jgi:hypothetical protein